MRVNRFQYLKMPYETILDKRLSQSDKFIYAAIITFAEGEKGCYATNQYLSECFRLDIQTVRRSIRRLKSLGLIEEEHSALRGSRRLTGARG